MAINIHKKRNMKGYLFIAPYFIVFLLLQFYPILYTLFMSFQRQVTLAHSEFAGLENYRRLFTNPLFYKAIANTWIIWLVNFVPQIIIALLLSVILSEYKVRGKETFRLMYFLPNLVTAASIGVLFSALLDWRTGTLNHMLHSFGFLPDDASLWINWLQSVFFARFTVSFIQWWQYFGVTMIIFMAGLSSISTEFYEAAIIDGANRWQKFRLITLPLLKPTMLYVMVTSVIGGMQIFDIPKVLTNGRGAPQNSLTTMVLYLYNQAFANFNIGYGAAVAYALFLIIFVFSALTYRLINPKETY